MYVFCIYFVYILVYFAILANSTPLPNLWFVPKLGVGVDILVPKEDGEKCHASRSGAVDDCPEATPEKLIVPQNRRKKESPSPAQGPAGSVTLPSKKLTSVFFQ